MSQILNLPNHTCPLRPWSVSQFTLVRRERVVCRRSGITYIYNEHDDGTWLVTKLKGGRVLAERRFASMPRNLVPILGGSRR